MNRKAFYSTLRKHDVGVFGTSLGQRQVDGIEALLVAGQGYPLAHMAHVLAEVYHETGGGMYPVKETVFHYSREKNPSDATVKARLSAAYTSGKLPWVKSPYWLDGYFGRGQIQITHEYNYRKASIITGTDLVADPNKALELSVSATIACEGCRIGMFTGRRMSDYDSAIGFDHHGARAIVNGDRHVNGKTIVQYGKAFELALQAAGWTQEATKPTPTPEPLPKPSGGMWAALVAVVVGIFAARKG